jgi:predicted nucleic acid-binding protein
MLFLDANVLLEILLGRDHEAIARRLIEEQHGAIAISALTAQLVVHFGQSIVGLPILRKFLADYTLLALDAPDFEWAFVNSRHQDYEDALQLAVAIRNGCTEFATFDKSLADAYSNLSSIRIQHLQ